MSGNNFKFKIATTVGDTFTDAAVSDILLNAVNGTNVSGRAILAGFTSSVAGAPATASAMRIGSNAVTVLGALSSTSVSASSAAFTTFSNAGNFTSHGLSNVGGVTYTQSLSNAGTLSCAGGDMRLDNNGTTTMFIDTYNPTANPTESPTAYWHFASVTCGANGGDSGGVDIQGSFSRVDQYCDVKFVSSTNNYQSPPYNAISELTSQNPNGKILMYANTAVATTTIDYYIYVESYSRAAFTFRGLARGYAYFNPIATFGPPPTTSATYTLVFDTTTMSLLNKSAGQLGVQGALSVSSNTFVGGVLTVGSNLAINGTLTASGNTFTTAGSNVGTVAYFSSIVDAGAATVGGTLAANGGLSVSGNARVHGAGSLVVDNGISGGLAATAFITQVNPNAGDVNGLSYWLLASFAAGDGAEFGGIVDIEGNFSSFYGTTHIKVKVKGTLGSFPYCCTALSEITVSAGGGIAGSAYPGNCAKIVVETITNGPSPATPVTVNVYVVAYYQTACNFTLRYDSTANPNLTPTWLQAAPFTNQYSSIFHDTSKNANIVITAAATIIPSLASTSITCTSNITCASISAGNIGLFRNRIINGDMRVDQRFSGAAHQATALSSAYLADRFVLASSVGTVTVQQQSNSLYAAMGASLGVYFPSMISVQVASGGAVTSIGSGDYVFVSQHIEGINIADFGWGTAAALPVVLSFYVASNVSGTYSASLRGNNQTAAMQFTISPVSGTTTWKRVVLSFPGNTVAGWATDSTNALTLDITLEINSNGYVTSPGVWQSGGTTAVVGQTNFMATVGNAIYFTGFQLERGTTVTPFESRPFQVELQLCQRYYSQLISTGPIQRLVACVGYSNSSTGGQLIGLYQYPVVMRATPVFSTNFGTSYAGYGLGVMLPVAGSSSLALNTLDGSAAVASLQANYSTTSSGVPSNFGGFITSTVAGQYLQFSAEI